MTTNDTAPAISVDDRGLAYGDGLFETLACINGQLQNWDLHWQRLIRGAKCLKMTIPEKGWFLSQIKQQLQQSSGLDSLKIKDHCIVKIIVTRGVGGRGYLFPESTENTILFRLHPWPERADCDYQQGIKTLVCQTMMAIQPALAGIKHLNRLEQVLARNEIDPIQYQDGIMLEMSCDRNILNMRVIEGTSSNLFFVIDGKLCTPEIDNCGIQGTIREVILASDIQVEKGHYVLRQLKKATEVFLTNSVFGVLPVQSISLTDNGREQWTYSKRFFTERVAALINQPLQRPFRF